MPSDDNIHIPMRPPATRLELRHLGDMENNVKSSSIYLTRELISTYLSSSPLRGLTHHDFCLLSVHLFPGVRIR